MLDAGELFNLIFPGTLAKVAIGGFRRRLEGELCAPLPTRERAGGRWSIARQFGDDCGEAVIVDGVERLQKSGDFAATPIGSRSVVRRSEKHCQAIAHHLLPVVV